MSAVLSESSQSNPLGGAGAAEAKFESLWSAGAFNPDGKPDAAQGQTASNEPNREPAQTSEAPAAAAPAQTQEQSEEVEYADLSDYLAKSQIEPESFYKMPVTVKIDGKTQNVPLADVLKSYQQEADYTRKTQALADQRRAWEGEQAQLKQAYTQQLQGAQQMLTLAQQQVLSEYQGVDWNKLYAEDPARFAAENQRFQMRVAQVQQYLGQVQTEQQRLQQQQMEELQSKTLPAERERLLEARPEWRDDKQFQAARTQMMSTAKQFGFSDAELSQVYDHRQMLVLDLASRYLALQAQAPDAVKRVRTAPITAQPGARTQRDPKAVQQTQLREAFKKNPRDQDTAARYFGTLT
jgi:hypothetical protein